MKLIHIAVSPPLGPIVKIDDSTPKAEIHVDLNR